MSQRRDEALQRFKYLLNAMEAAAQEENPAKYGYRDKRLAVLRHVEDLHGMLECARESLQSATPRSEPANARAVAWLRQIGHHWSEFGVEGMDELMREVRAYAATLPEAPQSETTPSGTAKVPEAPHRAVRIMLDIDADNRKNLEAAFRHFLHTFDNRSAPSGCSGGYSSGWTYQMWESDHPTHEEYEAALEQYLAAIERRDGNNGSAT